MSLEQSIADLVAMGGQNLALPQRIAETATAQIAAVSAAYQGRVAGLTVAVFVNQTTGSDNNPGTAASPLKSIEKAISLVPRGGLCDVKLQSDYVLTSIISMWGRELRISSDNNAVRRNFSFERFINTNSTPPIRGLRNFSFDATGSSLSFLGIKLNLPPMDGTWGSIGDGGGANCFAAYGDYPVLPLINMWSCEIVAPATIFASMFNATPFVLRIDSTTVTGSLNGKISLWATNAAGTAVASVAQHGIITNLTTI